MHSTHDCGARAGRGGIWIVLAIVTASCAGSGEGLDASGRPLDEGGGNGSVFDEIQQTVFTPICTECHAGGAAPLGLRLDAGNSYAQLVGVPSAQLPSLLRVDPGNPAASYLVRKLEGTASVGGRMPLGGPPLPPDRIDLIRQWIASGAPASVASPARPTFAVTSAVPADGEEVAGAPARLTLVFDSEVDASLAQAGTFELAVRQPEVPGTGGREGWTAVAASQVRVSLVNPTVVVIETAAPLGAGEYLLRIRGDGVPALADVYGRVLDGDGDGTPGGDFRLRFDVLTEVVDR